MPAGRQGRGACPSAGAERWSPGGRGKGTAPGLVEAAPPGRPWNVIGSGGEELRILIPPPPQTGKGRSVVPGGAWPGCEHAQREPAAGIAPPCWDWLLPLPPPRWMEQDLPHHQHLHDHENVSLFKNVKEN